MTTPPLHDRSGVASRLVKATDAGKRRRAVLAVADRARDAGDCAVLLDMLGLTVADARPGRTAA